MNEHLKKVAQDYREFFRDPRAPFSLLGAFLILFASLVINFFASQFAYIRKDNPVADLLLDILPVVNMDEAFFLSTSVFLVFIVVFLAVQPKQLSYVIKTIALFVIVRSIFVVLTHIGPSPLSTLTTPSDIGRAFSSGADLFFSGHTGMPFLFALMYWNNAKLRVLFILMSVMAAAGVLLGHIHYSIDVASAYFITHGIYLISKRFFKTDFERFNDNEHHARISH